MQINAALFSNQSQTQERSCAESELCVSLRSKNAQSKASDPETHTRKPAQGGLSNSNEKVLSAVVLTRFFELSLGLFASFFGFAFVQPEILQRLTQTSTRRQAVQNRSARDIWIATSQVL